MTRRAIPSFSLRELITATHFFVASLEIFSLGTSLVCSLEGIASVILVGSFEMISKFGQNRASDTSSWCPSSDMSSSSGYGVARAPLASIFLPVGIFKKHFTPATPEATELSRFERLFEFL
jgi:hypothetical protein